MAPCFGGSGRFGKILLLVASDGDGGGLGLCGEVFLTPPRLVCNVARWFMAFSNSCLEAEDTPFSILEGTVPKDGDLWL